MESAALSRANAAADARGPTHHLLLDEFSQFTAQSETALTRMLSETRKYGLFCVMAHQNWSQADERLRGALQNAGLEFIFKAGRLDAEYSARLLGWVDPMSIKHQVDDEEGGKRTHPAYFPLQEQWEKYIQEIQFLEVGHAFVRLPNDSVRKIHTPTLPTLRIPKGALEEVKQEYLHRYFEPAATADSVASESRSPSRSDGTGPKIGRIPTKAAGVLSRSNPSWRSSSRR